MGAKRPLRLLHYKTKTKKFADSIIFFCAFSKSYKNKKLLNTKFFKFWSFINLPWGHVSSHTKFGFDRISLFDVYWIQTKKQTDRQAKFIYRYDMTCIWICQILTCYRTTTHWQRPTLSRSRIFLRSRSILTQENLETLLVYRSIYKFLFLQGFSPLNFVIFMYYFKDVF